MLKTLLLYTFLLMLGLPCAVRAQVAPGSVAASTPVAEPQTIEINEIPTPPSIDFVPADTPARTMPAPVQEQVARPPLPGSAYAPEDAALPTGSSVSAPAAYVPVTQLPPPGQASTDQGTAGGGAAGLNGSPSNDAGQDEQGATAPPGSAVLNLGATSTPNPELTSTPHGIPSTPIESQTSTPQPGTTSTPFIGESSTPKGPEPGLDPAESSTPRIYNTSSPRESQSSTPLIGNTSTPNIATSSSPRASESSTPRR